MSDKIKNSVIVAMLTFVTIPFLLITDIFPFMRFGMFAEPVKGSQQLETFEVSYLDKRNREIKVNPKDLGIEPHFFTYITRNYYYRKESDRFLSNVSHIAKKEDVLEWRLKRIILSTNEKRGDTTLVVTKRYE